MERTIIRKSRCSVEGDACHIDTDIDKRKRNPWALSVWQRSGNFRDFRVRVRGPMSRVHDLTPRTASLCFTRSFTLSASGLPPPTVFQFVPIKFSTVFTSNHSVSAWCAVDTSQSLVMEFLTFFLDPVERNGNAG